MVSDPNLNTENITPELIQYIVQRIVQEVQPEKIILFGSYARGDFGQDSDLDLFIAVEGGERIQPFNQAQDRWAAVGTAVSYRFDR
jgi:predicted nucleotidyltransferase